MNIFSHEIKSGLSNIVLAILAALMVGLCEELVFRGVVFNKLQVIFSGTRNLYLISALLSSCSFGLVHLVNALDQSWIGTITQVYFAFATGMCFCGIYLFSGTLWIPVLLHAITDASTFLLIINENAAATSFDWIKLGLATLNLIIGFVLLIVYEKKGAMTKKTLVK